MNQKAISVLIPSLNRPKDLIRTLMSVLESSSHIIEVLVCDQSEIINDDLVLMSLRFSKLLYFYVDFKSLTKARNFLVDKARGDICVFLDDDVVLLPGYFDRITEFFDNKKIVGLTGPILAPYKNFNGLSVCNDVALYQNHLSQLKEHNPVWMVGCNHAFRKADIVKVNGYDENFYGVAIGEDADMSVRVRKSCGGNLLFYPGMALIHFQVQSGGCRNIKQKFTSEFNRVANTNYHFLKCSRTIFDFFGNQIILLRSHLLNKKNIFSIYLPGSFVVFVLGWIYGLYMLVNWFRFGTRCSYSFN